MHQCYQCDSAIDGMEACDDRLPHLQIKLLSPDNIFFVTISRIINIIILYHLSIYTRIHLAHIQNHAAQN